MIQANWLAGKAPQAEPVMSIFAAVFVGSPRRCRPRRCSSGSLVALRGVLLPRPGRDPAPRRIPLTARLGAPGLALGALVANLVGQVALQVPMAARACGIPIVEWPGGPSRRR